MERLWRRPERAAVFGARPNHARKRQRSQACLDLPHGRHSKEVRIRADPCVYRKRRPFDLITESLNVGHDGRADILRLEPGCLALRERSYFDGGEEIPRGLSGEVLHEAILLRREDVNGTTPPIAVTQPLRVRSTNSCETSRPSFRRPVCHGRDRDYAHGDRGETLGCILDDGSAMSCSTVR